MMGGGSRSTMDIPPFMLAVGGEQATVRNINQVGMQRAGIPAATISLIKDAYRLIFRQRKTMAAVRAAFAEKLNGAFPAELAELLDFLDRQAAGKQGRQREVFRSVTPEIKLRAA
jgi:UDP-N-acetylglucosamine acyltransferase